MYWVPWPCCFWVIMWVPVHTETFEVQIELSKLKDVVKCAAYVEEEPKK